jgi:hypothetical protein
VLPGKQEICRGGSALLEGLSAMQLARVDASIARA